MRLPEEQRIKIAEFCGWTEIHHHNSAMADDFNCSLVGKHEDSKAYNILGGYSAVPDYLNDLNAMHEAEKRLNGQQQINYCNELDNVVFKGGLIPTMATRMHVVHASATQRADAFLETMNLCKESSYATA